MTETMPFTKVIEELNEVLQIDLDAIGAYQAAMLSISETNVKSCLADFKADHERHVTELQALIRSAGGMPVEGSDIMGFFQKGMTRLAGIAGTAACLRAMQMNEAQTNAVYERHCDKPFPPDVLAVLRKNREDERRHAAWIADALRTRLWEQPIHVS